MKSAAMTVMNSINDNEYLAHDMSMSMKREYGETPNGNNLSGRWVLRDAKGIMLDFDQYRNDLAERHFLDLLKGR